MKKWRGDDAISIFSIDDIPSGERDLRNVPGGEGVSGVRKFDLRVVMFGDGGELTVTVTARSRAAAFTAAALMAEDSNNVYQVTIIRDNGRTLVDGVDDYGGVRVDDDVDDGLTLPLSVKYGTGRIYEYDAVMMNEGYGGTGGGLIAPTRAEAFTAAVVHTHAANVIRTIVLSGYADDDREFHAFEPTQKYGGVYEFREG